MTNDYFPDYYYADYWPIGFWPFEGVVPLVPSSGGVSDHFPLNLPQMTLNGRNFYVRSGTLSHMPVPKEVEVDYGLSGNRKRTIFIRSRGWSFRVACRSPDDRNFLESLVNDVNFETYSFDFIDGTTGSTYEVVVEDVGKFTPVVDNTDFWDVDLALREWV